MFPFSWISILLSDENANPQADIRCPLCGERLRICRYGYYWRYRFEDDGRIAVQRFGCLNPGCPRQTFSVPPHPYLPICRIPLCLLMVVLILHRVKNYSISQCARFLNLGWNAVKRALACAYRLVNWFVHESAAGAIPPIPCLEHTWPAFVRAYSYAFLPDRR